MDPESEPVREGRTHSLSAENYGRCSGDAPLNPSLSRATASNRASSRGARTPLVVIPPVPPPPGFTPPSSYYASTSMSACNCSKGGPIASACSLDPPADGAAPFSLGGGSFPRRAGSPGALASRPPSAGCNLTTPSTGPSALRMRGSPLSLHPVQGGGGGRKVPDPDCTLPSLPTGSTWYLRS